MRKLYKYVTADTSKKILENGTMRWSTPAVLNDPFDMQFAFQLPTDMQAARAKIFERWYRRIVGERINRATNSIGSAALTASSWKPTTREEFEQEIGSAIDQSLSNLVNGAEALNKWLFQEHFANSKILCFSEIHDSILMWSYYAANHSGLVLRFTSNTTNSALSSARPVRYIDQMPPLYDEEALSDLLDLEGHHTSDADRIMNEVVWTKSSHWAHEREWRLYAGVGESVAAYEDVPFAATELDGVIFGLRIAEEDKATITDLIQAKYPHAESLQAKAKPNAYELVIKSLGGDGEA
jgi:hypothetical protein